MKEQKVPEKIYINKTGLNIVRKHELFYTAINLEKYLNDDIVYIHESKYNEAVRLLKELVNKWEEDADKHLKHLENSYYTGFGTARVICAEQLRELIEVLLNQAKETEEE